MSNQNITIIEPKYYFLLYNDNTHIYYINELLKSIKKYGKEFEIVLFNKEYIDSDFFEINKEILLQDRGGGYWLWKPYIINYIINRVNDNDIIFYCDSKYLFIDDISKLYEDFFKNKNNNILVWKNKPNDDIYFMKNWCKMDVILKYNMYDKIFIEKCEDSWAGAMVIKKTDETVKYIREWLDMCCVYENITDTSSNKENHKEFKEHRHDQSLLSIVLHKYKINLQYFEKGVLQNCRNPY